MAQTTLQPNCCKLYNFSRKNPARHRKLKTWFDKVCQIDVFMSEQHNFEIGRAIKSVCVKMI
jgi:hypothetical protein